jgi:predicted transcriptional regulator
MACAPYTLHVRITPTEAVSDPSTMTLPSYEAFSQVFAPKRLALLSLLRGVGPISIRALAQQLRRDYKNVHGDVTMLIETGILRRDTAGEISTPWDRIEVQLPL